MILQGDIRVDDVEIQGSYSQIVLLGHKRQCHWKKSCGNQHLRSIGSYLSEAILGESLIKRETMKDI